MMNFQRPVADGWRYSPSHRCTRVGPGWWVVERWSAPDEGLGVGGLGDWVTIGVRVSTYEQCRAVATADFERRLRANTT